VGVPPLLPARVQNPLHLHRLPGIVPLLSRHPAIALALALPAAALAQEESPAVDAWIGSLRVWLTENVEEDTFEAVGLDAAEIDRNLRRLQEAVAEDLREPAPPTRADVDTLIEVLDQFEPTSEGAGWLKAFLGSGPAPPASELPSVDEGPTPLERRDPIRLAWEQRLASRPPPSRAEDYVAALKAAFASEGVPPELVWIAEVESSFNPEARSHVGAVGLFQLMPDTAEELGLAINLFQDERRDPDKSARAAARYLRALRRQFQDWPLVLAAYNAGPGRVAYLLSALEATTYAGIAHRLPEETQVYVPKVEATVWIREGVELRNLPAGSARATRAGGSVTAPPASSRPEPDPGHGWANPPVGRSG